MKKILVALDTSERADHVLRAAIDLADRLRVKVVLMRAVNLPGDLPPEAYAMSPDGVLRVLEQRARADLQKIATEVPRDLLAGEAVRVGVPWQAICEAAREQEADLIVIGSHGYGGFDRLLGTTAAKVVNHADRSVLVIRQAESAKAPH